MAIVIPSKNIYGDAQNPKVRDNVIERIEVGAIEVVPNNEYDSPVYNSDLGIEDLSKKENTEKEQYRIRSRADSETLDWYVAYVYLDNLVKYKSGNIIIPKIQKNKIINYIYFKDKENKSLINYSIAGTIIKNKATQTIYGVGYEVGSKSELVLSDQQIEHSASMQLTELPITITVNNWANASLTSLANETSFNISDDNDNYYLQYNILCYLKILYLKGKNEDFLPPSMSAPNATIEATGELQEFIPEQLSITINGDTIGIDLNDKTVYINGETAKKVHSVDGNELMQTSNYIDENGTKTSTIEKMYEQTQKGYQNGKETVTIRCSISDYYDYADRTKKVIAIDNSTGKMSFKMYDQVIPMVYGADGKDRPMSLYQDGSPKVFQMLGSNIYYDGAVWQELSLQEVDKI